MGREEFKLTKNMQKYSVVPEKLMLKSCTGSCMCSVDHLKLMGVCLASIFLLTLGKM